MQVNTYNIKGEKAGTAELPDGVFGLKWNNDLVHQVVTSQSANARVHTAKTKDRREVRGGGKKPWRQKGTGRARHGSIRSPLWRGGGITHGPLTEKNFKKKINKKMAKKALFTVLSAKARDNEIVVVDGLAFAEGKTKQASIFFTALSRHDAFGRMLKGNGALVALPRRDDATRRAMRNLPYIGIDLAKNIHAHEVLQYKFMVIAKEAVESFAVQK